MVSIQIRPYALNQDEGLKLQLLGAQIVIKASSIETSGAFNLFEVRYPVGFTTSLHIHYAEEVAVYVLEGELTYFWGREKYIANSGTYLFQPRGTPHGFRVDSGRMARVLYLTIPAGLDRLFYEQDVLASDTESMIVAARYKIEVLGPLPD